MNHVPENILTKPTAMAMHLLSRYIYPGEGVVDATAGNGCDTLALARAQSQGNVGNIYSFDVQDQAIENTHKLLLENGFSVICDRACGNASDCTCEEASNHASDNAYDGVIDSAAGDEAPQIHLIKSCHSLLNEYIPEEEMISAVLFNLGYLPGGDKHVTTGGETTCLAVLAALKRIKPQGAVVIVTYGGHEAGAEEKSKLVEMLTALPRREYHVSYIKMINQPAGAPEVLAVTKKG